jgi:chemotaxis-related protein WspB
MLLILCYAGPNRYAVDAKFAEEVLPRVALHRVSQAPPWCSGLLIHRGAAIPVVDLVNHALGQPCPNRLSNRIVVLRADVDAAARRVGILAEAVGLRESSGGTAVPGGAQAPAEDRGRLLLDDEGVLELLDVERLMREDWRMADLPGAARQT